MSIGRCRGTGKRFALIPGTGVRRRAGARHPTPWGMRLAHTATSLFAPFPRCPGVQAGDRS